MSIEKSLAGQVAWVTGSSRGLGRVIATELCRLGAAVAVHGTQFDSPRSFGEGESMEQVARDLAAVAGGQAMPVWGDVTLLFSLRENAIAKEPGLGYPERWRCVSRLGLFNGGLDSFESSPYVTLSRGAFSAPSLVTPSR